MPFFNQNRAILFLFHHRIPVILLFLCCPLRGKSSIIVEYWIKQSTGYHLWSRLCFCRNSHSICPNSMALKKHQATSYEITLSFFACWVFFIIFWTSADFLQNLTFSKSSFSVKCLRSRSRPTFCQANQNENSCVEPVLIKQQIKHLAQGHIEGSESRTSNPSIPSLTLYQLRSTCKPITGFLESSLN